ncbi:uncharacterized protein BDR25DRAFT_349813 [Lindgomyces ingoldianus]|uniref:Uncharacterized protein n=1 Tax=Lindgomyces ingoldianus TaxID=673940 RepID=A0ACB6RBY8_9PLEO|nr:uncharacterized protein BDR25DRAFT_349813 [Lindgomyces ingoldianus]KAF2476754.1 hypothetical protein BDR25DRAFT_349813 [Lindgomyces ingoldianus]
MQTSQEIIRQAPKPAAQKHLVHHRLAAKLGCGVPSVPKPTKNGGNSLHHCANTAKNGANNQLSRILRALARARSLARGSGSGDSMFRSSQSHFIRSSEQPSYFILHINQQVQKFSNFGEFGDSCKDGALYHSANSTKKLADDLLHSADTTQSSRLVMGDTNGEGGWPALALSFLRKCGPHSDVVTVIRLWKRVCGGDIMPPTAGRGANPLWLLELNWLASEEKRNKVTLKVPHSVNFGR